MKKLIFLILVCTRLSAQTIQFPLAASDNKKYLVDKNKTPVFLNGIACWRVGYGVSLAEANRFFTDCKTKGYNALIIEITPDFFGKEGGNHPNIYGEYPFYNKDLAHPNENFFLHMDSVLQLSQDMNLAVLLFPLYLGCCHDGWLEFIQQQPNSIQKCRDYGKWIADRYKHLANIIWISGGDHNETPESLAAAEGIAERDTIHLHSFHPSPGYTSVERLPDARWLTLSSTYTYFPVLNPLGPGYHVYAQLYMEGVRNNRMPFIMSESAYENERDETTQTLRRQAYWSLLSGACGHVFGNRDTWPMNKSWPDAVNTPGNQSMKVFGSFIKSIPWYNMIPDWQHTLFTGGRGQFNGTDYPGGEDYATAAFSKDSTTAVLYMPSFRTVCVNMKRFAGNVTVSWFDPSDGSYLPVAKIFPAKAVAYFTPPSKTNRKGFDDWVLILTCKNKTVDRRK